MGLMNELGLSELIEGMTAPTIDSAIKYISNNTISVIQFIGFLSLFAHTTDKSYYDYIEKIEEIFNKRLLHKNIYNELEKIDIIYSNIDNIEKDEIQKLLDESLSNNILHIVAIHEPIKLKSNFNYYGLNYLFPLLINNDRINFENWIKTSKRIDFKILFLNQLFSYHYNRNIDITKIENSDMGLLQALWALSNFKLIHICRNVYLAEELDITSLFNSKISDKNKFIIYLQYIINKYHGRNLKELNKTIELDTEIDKFSSIDYDYTKEDLIDITGSYYSILCFKIIQNCKNQEKKGLFLKELQKILLAYLEHQEFIQHSIDYAKLLGLIAIERSDCEDLEKLFDKEYKELSFPYSFFKIRNWSQRVVFLFYLLIGIKTYKNNVNQDITNYIEKFNFIKSGIKKSVFNDIDKYINDIK